MTVVRGKVSLVPNRTSPWAQPDLGRDPVAVAARLAHLPGFIYFDSARGDWGSVSMIAACPERVISGSGDVGWGALAAAIASRNGAEEPISQACEDALLGGIVAGAIAYDGEMHFGVYRRLLVHRHEDGAWFSAGNLEAECRAPGGACPAAARVGRFRSAWSAERFERAVRRAQEYIAAGDIYQVNIAHRFEAALGEGDLWPVYERLRSIARAPYGGYYHMGAQTLLSASPELFLRMRGRSIVTRPIKGTRRRAFPDQEDIGAIEALRESAKERAELVMITDLERNDLGQVCAFGSIAVKELLCVEAHPHLYHLVSTIEGRLRPEVTHLEALRACFPGGSITGAPKLRATEIIRELEETPRNWYTGAFGWFSLDGMDSQFSIIIRSLLADRERDLAHFSVGAGIVADSVPTHEWGETLTKARAILLACAAEEGESQ
jgi:anthranilate/para-aminobenzoate synthase component I